LALTRAHDTLTDDDTEQTLGAFVRAGHVSRRVSNVIRQLPKSNPIDSLPLSQVLANWSYVEEYLRSRRSFGATSARELRVAIDSCIRTRPITSQHRSVESKPLVESLASHPLAPSPATALMTLSASRATQRAVSELPLSEVTLLDLLTLPLPDSKRAAAALIELRDDAAAFFTVLARGSRSLIPDISPLPRLAWTNYSIGPSALRRGDCRSGYRSTSWSMPLATTVYCRCSLLGTRCLSQYPICLHSLTLRTCRARATGNAYGSLQPWHSSLRQLDTRPVCPLSPDQEVSVDSLCRVLLAGLSDQHRDIVTSRVAPAANDPRHSRTLVNALASRENVSARSCLVGQRTSRWMGVPHSQRV
jgi:hypothetical protein